MSRFRAVFATLFATVFATVPLALVLAAGDAQAQADRLARVERAEAALRRGDRAQAEREGAALVAEYRQGGSRGSAREHVIGGRAWLLVSRGDAEAVRAALRAFDAAAAADSTLSEAVLRASDLFLDRYVAPEALKGYEQVLRRDPRNAWALLGVARVMEFTGRGDALGKAREALAADARHVPALLFIARRHLEAERHDSARAVARRALDLDDTQLEGWATLGAAAWSAGDDAGFREARARAERIAPRPAAFYVVLADAAARSRRYAEAERFAAQALELDSLSVPALGAVGTNRLRTGDLAAGRAHIERAFALDPFNLWHKNTLDLLDKLATFRTVRLGRFEFVADTREADLLLPYLSPLLEEAYDRLAARYDYRPPVPVRLEIYDRHADFSVRTVGLTGLGALGVSFGRLLAIDAPSARDPGTFNWGSTAWHELAHTFTLGLSDNRVPRWFSEGVSVHEERRARPGWGARETPQYLAALRQGVLRPVSQLNEGFVRPRDPGEVVLSYYHASLVVEMIEQEFGASALGTMLRLWRDGRTTPQVIQGALRLDEATLDARFDRWVRARFAGASVAAAPAPDPRREALAGARPRAVGDTLPAGDADIEPIRREVERLARAGHDSLLVDALERMLWIWPYDPAMHEQLAEAATRAGMPGKAVRERQAVIALGPSDRLAARVELARALLAAGDRGAARREILGVLEQAPTYERAQQVLLDLRRTPPEER